MTDDTVKVLPDYTGGGIANLMVSLAEGLGMRPGALAPQPPLSDVPVAEVADAPQVVLLVIDGLGQRQLLRHRPEGVLAGHLRGTMTSVFPSTTATAITTFLTGEVPARHAMTGWYMWLRELGAVMTVLPGRPRYGGVDYDAAGVDLGRLYGHVPLYDRLAVESVVLSPAAIARSAYNRAHLGRARLLPYDGLDDLCSRLGEVCATPPQGGRRFVYAYWSELDRLGHMHGADSDELATHLGELDDAFEGLLDALAGRDVLLLATADHGQVDAVETGALDLGVQRELADLLRLPLCGERRAAYAYLRPGTEEAFLARMEGDLAEYVEALPGGRLIRDGWFGHGEPHPELANRVGDYVLLPRGHYVFTDWLQGERPFRQVGVHGGLTEDEMRVPLILVRT